jgi:osmotically-inducible protein OsmY
MNTKFATTLVVGALLAPVAGYAADKPMKESVKESVSDAVITTKIKAEFAKDKTVSAMHVKVDTDDKGVVTLSGTAKSKAEADQAVKIARDTKGVASVKNEIMVNAPVTGMVGEKSTTQTVKDAVSDSAITTKIKAEFAKDKTVSATSVKVDTDDKGIVTLSGTAKSSAEADQAVKLARNTSGVISVKNNIVVQGK